MHNRNNQRIENVEKLNEGASSGAEAIERAHDIHFIHDAISGGAGSVDGTTAIGEVINGIPIVGHFVRGLIYLYEAYHALHDHQQENRKLKIATGLTAGLVSIGTGIVATLALASVGLLATAVAVLALPIIIPSVVTGIYAATAVRDIYFYYVKRKEEQQLQNSIDVIDANIIRLIEHPNKSNPGIQKELINAVHEKSNLLSQLNAFSTARKNARNKAIFSTAIMVGVGILSMAIFATGFGVILMAGVGITTILSSLIVHYVHQKYPGSHPAAISNPPTPAATPLNTASSVQQLDATKLGLSAAADLQPDAIQTLDVAEQPLDGHREQALQLDNAPEIHELPPEEANPPEPPSLQFSAVAQTTPTTPNPAVINMSTSAISTGLHISITTTASFSEEEKEKKTESDIHNSTKISPPQPDPNQEEGDEEQEGHKPGKN